MQPTLAALLSFAAISTAASGRLFDTPQELVQRMDGHVFHGESSGTFPFESVKRGTIGQLPVEASFFKGRCLLISYQYPDSAAILGFILEKNRGNSSWTKQDEQTWTRADGAAFARRGNGRLSLVSTDLAPDWKAMEEGRFNEVLIKSALEKL
jgi:hypothetical protein